MNIRYLQEARENYGIDSWGSGYFSIDRHGEVVCHPNEDETQAVSLPQIIAAAKEQHNLRTPLIIRFPQIIAKQVERLHGAFRESIFEYNFKGHHMGVFPFKVNQRREFIDAVTHCGQDVDYGLEVGSKTELVAALSYPQSKKALLIVNGFKDREFIDMCFVGKSMGKNVIIVVEDPEELAIILETKDRYPNQEPPVIGLRVRLYSRGAGKWEKSSGEGSKFGMTATEVIHALWMLEKAGQQELLQMLHFHIGSQITEIKRFKNAIKEASRFYAKVVKEGFAPSYLNIGGGVGVDYDGSKTSFASSANYSLQEFSNDAVYVLGQTCNEEQVKHPTIITESGRVIAAYHSVIATDIREVQGDEIHSPHNFEKQLANPDLTKCIKELKYIYENINRKNFVEYYHDAIEYQEELFTLFNLGLMSLKERALGEGIFHRICRRALYYSSFQRHVPPEFEQLEHSMVSKYLANFSMFQSIPDAWSIDQLFPVMPLSRHGEKPTEKATIIDITCDSDGCLDRFIDRREVRSSLDLHEPSDAPYYIGFFLVGAYQESLANEHNLFGAIHEVEVEQAEDGQWKISKTTLGDPISELLECRNYELAELEGNYLHQFKSRVASGELNQEDADKGLAKLKIFLHAYPYLHEDQDSEVTK
jgi:arginine decarboxylase